MRSRPTSRMRRIAVLLGLAACVVTTASCTSSAGSAPSSGAAASNSESDSGTYLALGDSVPFGFIGNAESLYPDPDNFVGDPEMLADDLRVRVLNASCPGETTASFIDDDAQSNGCENSLTSPVGYRDRFPLHVQYDDSQLDYAVETLEEGPHVRLVTLQLGANDLFVCVSTDQCTTPAGVRDLAASVQNKLDRILSTLRDEGEYRGRIAVVTYYSLDYTDPVGVALIQAVNRAMTAAAVDNGAVVADGFGAFRSRALEAGGSSIAAGLVYPNDVHPTAEGHRLLANAVEQAIGH
jgi:lysophospholipase L1-like esterase